MLNKFFLKKFASLALVVLSLIVLLLSAQFVSISDVTKQGPTAVLADVEDFTQIGPGNVSEPWFFEPIPGITDQPAPASQPEPQAPAPQPAAPSCGSFEFKYNECIACNQSRRVEQNSCGEYKTSVNSGTDAACSSWCPAAPAPQPQAPAPQPAAPAPQPQAPSQVCVPNQFDSGSCRRCAADGTFWGTPGSDFGSNHGSAEWCGCAARYSNINNHPVCAPQGAPIAPPAPVTPPSAQLPECRDLATNTVCGGQKAYDTCTESTVNGVKVFSCVASQNPNCSGVIQCSQPAPVTPTIQTTQCPSGTTAITATNNVITCITNQQQQSQSQTVTQHNNQVINIPGGIVSRTEIIREQPVAIQVARVDCPAGTVKKVVDREVICEVTGRAVATVAGAKELPKTGLPALAWAVGALVPVGIKLRRFSKFLNADLISSPGYIWEDRQFKR